ncbi:MAG TPA: 3-hydroxyacyl-CoA dehydrogenase NAD-binding domain-containing protein [bacterium]
MSSPVSYERKGAVGVITIDSPPVNALSHAVRQGLADAVTQAAGDGAAKALLLICAGRTFSAGADIKEFGKPPQAPVLWDILEKLDGSAKPVVAAIHGTAFGGGLEVALACHYRCAVPEAKFGLPEVKLGLLPGAGGTQALPRLIGVEPAVRMITSGDPIEAAEAKQLGLCDQVISGDLAKGALAYAERLVKEGKGARRIRDLNDKIKSVPAGLFEGLRKDLLKRSRGNEAPIRCLDAVEAATKLPWADGIKRERELFVQAVTSQQSAALRYVFFAEREVAKIPDIGKEIAPRKIAKAAVLGAGTMGGGIAMNFANAGIPVLMVDTTKDLVDKGMGIIRKNYAATVAKGRLSQAEMDDRMSRIQGTVEFDAVRETDLVIEAVFEEMGLKKEIFGRLDKVCRPGTVLATNTSTLDVNEIASATSRPQDVVGMHFFSPANVMRLVEVVRGKQSSKEAVATAMAVSKELDKVGVLVGVCYGFVGNRMLHQYTREANYLLEEGALPQQVDKVITDFGLPMGPFQMGDLAGIDVGWRVRKGRKAAGTLGPERYAYTVSDTLAEQGRFGQKTSAGWYKYEAGNRTPVPDPAVEALILEASKTANITRRKISNEEILARCIYPMINEGAKILDEGIALRALDIDVIWINGYGFPAHRGGPMFYADSVGPKAVYDAVAKNQQQFGDHWKPSPLLKRLADEGKFFTR